MWEWLFSHPARPGAIFLAEMIAPVAANPLYLTAPLFPGVLFGCVYGWSGGIAGAVLVGVPVALTLACVAKAIEIRVVLRLSPRVRGAVLGVMGWFGFASMMAFCLLYSSLQPLVASVSLWLAPFGDLPWPPARMLLGRTPQGYYAFSQGLVLCWLVAVILILGSVAFSVASLRRGLAGQSGFAPGRVAEPACFGRMPLYRKELLWFRRDGRALVRAILVPLSLAALQIFNLRWLISNAADAWNTICGFAILFGTYFLLTLGPQSLASEGQALWIAQTWPRGLEILLKTKAKLWTWIATAIVELVFVYAAWRYPANLASIVMVGVLWWVFARSLAEKTVTLATVRSRSDELQKPPAGLWWAATLGTMSFAVGVFTRQWALAVAGVVYSILTAAAMWQNFRYRLPFLADPWSETLPPPPTLLHAMVAISAMVEGVSALSALALWGFGRDRIAPINAGLYGVCAIVTALAVSRFLVGRGVAQRDIWLWRDGDRTRGPHLDAVEKLRGVTVVVCGDALGAALGLAAHLYLSALHWWPQISEALDEVQKRTDALPNARAGYAVIAVGFAPFAEEFLFRGLLYRALDREWGGWRAVVGAGAFFAIYHPALSWAPVTVLGVINALLFKRTGQLAPAVAAHITYNAVVLAL
jgi:membrane protease YdiL (CAAX protease family)